MDRENLKKYFDWICIIELITCFLLFCIAMPLKYGLGVVEPMFPIGLIHGLAFMIYIVMAFAVRGIYGWKGKEFMTILLYGFIPFFTWFVHKKVANANQLKTVTEKIKK